MALRWGVSRVTTRRHTSCDPRRYITPFYSYAGLYQYVIGIYPLILRYLYLYNYMLISHPELISGEHDEVARRHFAREYRPLSCKQELPGNPDPTCT